MAIPTVDAERIQKLQPTLHKSNFLLDATTETRKVQATGPLVLKAPALQFESCYENFPSSGRLLFVGIPCLRRPSRGRPKQYQWASRIFTFWGNRQSIAQREYRGGGLPVH